MNNIKTNSNKMNSNKTIDAPKYLPPSIATDAAAGALQQRPTMAWAAPTRVHESPGGRILSQAAVMLFLVGLSVLDAHLLKPALSSVLRQSPDETFELALGVSAAASAAAAMSGWHLKGAIAGHPESGKHLVPPLLLLGGWAGLGLTLAYIRVVGGVRHVVSYEASATGASSTTGGSAWAGAGMFLVFYLLVGALAALDLYHLRNDAASALRRVERRRRLLLDRLVKEEALLRRLIESHAIRKLQAELAVADAATAKAANAAFARELYQLSRHHQAVRLASPAATGITSPRHPDNPSGPADSATRDAP